MVMPLNPSACAQVQRDLKSLPRCFPTQQSFPLPLTSRCSKVPCSSCLCRAVQAGGPHGLVVYSVLENSWPFLRHAYGMLGEGRGSSVVQDKLLKRLETCRQLRHSQAARSSWKLAPGAREQVLESHTGEPS